MKLLHGLLLSSLIQTPLWAQGEEYERAGFVFSNATAVFVKEKDERSGFITHKPKALSLATVRSISPESVVHYKYFEKRNSFDSVQSFAVTANTHGLKETSDELPAETQLASVPVKIERDATAMELLIFAEDHATGKDEYAPAVASALQYILNGYITALKMAGNLSDLKSVEISDNNPELAGILESSSFRQALSANYHLISWLPIQPGINEYFTLKLAIGSRQ
jgi:hypothetical protein